MCFNQACCARMCVYIYVWFYVNSPDHRPPPLPPGCRMWLHPTLFILLTVILLRGCAYISYSVTQNCFYGRHRDRTYARDVACLTSEWRHAHTTGCYPSCTIWYSHDSVAWLVVQKHFKIIKCKFMCIFFLSTHTYKDARTFNTDRDKDNATILMYKTHI